MVALHMLQKLGYRADVAANGYEVLNALERQDYDVILMDNRMPEMDGVEATRRIRADLPLEKQPYIVAMTASALEGDRERLLEAGMDDYVAKPVMLDKLVEALLRTSSIKSSSIQDPAPAIIELDTKDAPIDVSSFEERLGPGTADLLPQLVEMFLQEAKDKMPQLSRAVSSDDFDTTYEIAHRLVGSSSSTAATYFAPIADRLQKMALSKDLTGAAALVIELETEMDRIRNWFSSVSDHL